MNPLNRYTAGLIASSLCVGSLCAAPALVSPRVAPPTPEVAALVTAMNMHKPPHPNPKLHTVTSTVDGAPGSLRSVLAGASNGDTIKFALHLPATLSLSNSLVITQSVTIQGPGAGWLTVMRSSVSNTPLFRVFDIESGTVSMSGITIQNGAAFDFNGFVDNVGGGIFNRGNLTVNSCVITGNIAPSTTNNNTISIGFGAGIFSDSGSDLTLINTTVSGNQATGGGGGIYVLNGTLLAKGCTFSDNFAIIQGGGVGFQGEFGTIQNCTISGNSTPPGGAGSGLLTVAFEAQAAPSLTVTACTIAGNTGATNGAVCLIAENVPLGLTNTFLSTVVGDNDAPDFYNFASTFISLGHNLDSDGTSGMVNGSNGDIVGSSGSPIDPLLGPLQDNGGPTFTMALLVGSPALGTGSCSDASGAPLHVDQRGFPRPATTGCDIGAYENEPLTLLCPHPITVDFQTAAGAVVCYDVKVLDLCPSVTVTSTPPSGSLFPIGETAVSVEATDGCSSNTASCGFTVTVLSPQGVKSNVVEVLEDLAAKANPRDKQTLEQAIADVCASLGMDDPTNNLWLDPTHLDPQNGWMVFKYEQAAVEQLQQLGHSRWSRVSDSIAKGVINRLVKCDRLLASVSLQDAIQDGGNAAKIAQAKKEIALGDLSAAFGKSSDAIQHYWNAWSLTVNL